MFPCRLRGSNLTGERSRNGLTYTPPSAPPPLQRNKLPRLAAPPLPPPAPNQTPVPPATRPSKTLNVPPPPPSGAWPRRPPTWSAPPSAASPASRRWLLLAAGPPARPTGTFPQPTEGAKESQGSQFHIRSKRRESEGRSGGGGARRIYTGMEKNPRQKFLEQEVAGRLADSSSSSSMQCSWKGHGLLASSKHERDA